MTMVIVTILLTLMMMVRPGQHKNDNGDCDDLVDYDDDGETWLAQQ